LYQLKADVASGCKKAAKTAALQTLVGLIPDVRLGRLSHHLAGSTMHIVRLSDIGSSVNEAEIVVWLKHVGDSVAAGETLLEIQSDKANVEVEAPASGMLARVLAEEGQLIHTGEPIAVIADPDEPADQSAIDQALSQAGETPG
jgi:biotin carboxyl carrier protein